MSSSILMKIGHWFYVNTRFGRWYFNRSLDQVATDTPLGHSAPVTLDYGIFHVRIVSYSKDNYGFIIWRDHSKKCFIVDPGYFPPFQDVLNQLRLKLDSVLITHKHIDHCGGLSQIKDLYPDVKVFAHKNDKIKYCTHPINGALQIFDICQEENLYSMTITAYATPGHTVGHTVYTMNTGPRDFIDPVYPLLVFTGDNIFLGSIGAMFECSTETNLESLSMLIRNLLKLQIPSNRILLFPGHEYSMDSLQFILYNCAPNSINARRKLEWCIEQRTWRLPTIPVSLFDELSYSPYLRIATATKSYQKRTALLTLRDNGSLSYIYLPTLTELLNEFLLSERFIKTNIRNYTSNHINNSVNEESLRLKLFEDLFNEGKKMLLRCENCSPQPFAYHPEESTLPQICSATLL